MGNWQRFEYTYEFDCRIKELVISHGKKWRLIAHELDNVATEDAIRNRYIRLMGISRNQRADRSGTCNLGHRRYWSEEEDKQLARAVQQFGMKWDRIREVEFPQKSRQALRNRAYRMGLNLLMLM